MSKQVQLWMEAAESTKGLLVTENIDEQTASETHEQCSLQ